MKRNKKKVARLLLVSAMTLILSLGPLSIHPKAESMTWDYMYYHTSNNIRATCSGYREVDANYYIYDNPSNLKYREVIYVNFAGPVTGSFTLGLAQMQRGDVILTEDCVISSNVSSTSITFSVSGVDSCRIEVYSATSSRGLTSFTGNWSADADLDDINTTLNTIKGYVDGVETSLHNIYSALTILNSYTNDVESYLDTNNTILSRIESIEKMSSYPVWQQFAIFWGSAMGDMVYDGVLPHFYYDSSQNVGQAVNAKRIKIAKGRTTSLVLYSTVNNLASQYLSIYGSHASDVVVNAFVSTAVPIFPLYLYRIDFVNNYNGSNFISLEFSTDMTIYPLFLGDSLNIPDEVMILLGSDYDNTYTRLLQKIAEGVGSMSGTTVNNTTTNINNYTTSFTEVNNIENNIMVDFSPSLTVVDQSITDSGVLTPSSDIAAGADWVSYNFRLIQGIPLFKYPIYTILILFVAACLLG